MDKPDSRGFEQAYHILNNEPTWITYGVVNKTESTVLVVMTGFPEYFTHVTPSSDVARPTAPTA
jgi:hypothetical protein